MQRCPTLLLWEVGSRWGVLCPERRRSEDAHECLGVCPSPRVHGVATRPDAPDARCAVLAAAGEQRPGRIHRRAHFPVSAHVAGIRQHRPSCARCGRLRQALWGTMRGTLRSH